MGELQNSGSTTATAVLIDLAYEDASGTVLATDETPTLLDSINPGQKSPFLTIATPPSGYAQTVITGLSDLPSSTPANTNFTTVVTNTFTDSSGFPNIVDTVTNDNTTTPSFVEVMFTFYGPPGNVVDTDFTFIQPQPPSLAPGQTADFQEINTSGVTYSSYACVAYSDTPPSTPTPPSPAPGITSFTPTSGPLGSTVTLTGSGFAGATAVSFKGHAASFKVRSDTQIVATVPAGSSSGPLSVTTAGGSANSAARFIVMVKPTLTLKLSGLTSGAMKLGKSLTAKGTVTPTSLAGSKVTLIVQRKQGGTWLKVTSMARTISVSGTYSATYKLAKKGTYRMKTTIAKTATHTAATTTWLTFKVK